MRKREFYPAAAVFDMDGLMIDSERVVQHSWNVVGRCWGMGNLGDDNIRHTLGLNRTGRKEYFLEKYGEAFDYEAFQKEYARVYQEYARTRGVPVKEGLYGLLDVLEKKGIKMAVATSSSRDNALGHLKRAGIETRFQAVLTGDMVSRGKPDPEIYEKTCALLGVRPEEAMALEDAPNGILSAHRAGLYTVLVPDLFEDFARIEDITDRRMQSLGEVAQWLKGLKKG